MTQFQPKDPTYETRVRDSFARQALMRTIGARLGRIEPGRVEIELPFRADLTQQHGYVDGKHDKLYGRIQKRTGETRETIEKAVKEACSSCCCK